MSVAANLLGCLAILIWLGAAAFFTASKSAIQEIESFVLFLIATTLGVGAVMIQKLHRIRRELERLADRSHTDAA